MTSRPGCPESAIARSGHAATARGPTDPRAGPADASARMVGMSAYWIAVYREVLDEEKLAAYAALAGPAIIDAGGTFLARGLPEQTYEHAAATRTVLIRFDSVDAARAAHDSPAYQEALAALDGGAVREIRVVPGVD